MSKLLSFLEWGVARAEVSLPENIRPETLPSISGGTVEGQAGKIVGDVVLTAIQFAGAIAIIFIIISAFRYVLSRGEDEELGKAKAGIFWSIAALLILILSYTLVATIFDLAVSLGGSGS